MHYQINNQKITLDIKGQSQFGDKTILVDRDDNLVNQVSWKDDGYTVVPFLSVPDFVKLNYGLKEIFRNAIRQAGFNIPVEFEVSKYHELPGLTQEKHLEVIAKTKLIYYKDFPIDPQKIVTQISELVNVPLCLKNPQTEEEIFHLRIVRPNSSDFNPLHRDAWMDELKHSLNLYVGVAGSTELSSLCLVPGSHLWPESKVERTIEGAIMNGAQYNVPALIHAQEKINLIRPNPGYNEVLVFTPYLIHGGSVNLNSGHTRISLELRLWRK